MTDLYDRLFPQFEDGQKLAVKPLCSVLEEYIQGYMTGLEVLRYVNLDGDATADLRRILVMLDSLHSAPAKDRWLRGFEAVCMLAEHGVRYGTKASFATRLGLG